MTLTAAGITSLLASILVHCNLLFVLLPLSLGMLGFAAKLKREKKSKRQTATATSAWLAD